MSGAFLRRRDRTGRPLRVEHYSAAVNRLALARAADGTMTVTVDGDEVIAIKSTALSNGFEGVAIVNSGGDYAVRNIALYSTL